MAKSTRLTAFDVFQLFMSLPKDRQHAFYELCLDSPESNILKERHGGVSLLVREFCDLVRKQNNARPTKNAKRDDEIVRLRDGERPPRSFGQIGRDDRVKELNGGEKMDAKRTEAAYRRRKLALRNKLQIDM